MNWRRLLTYIIFTGLFAPLWVWVTIAADGRFLNSFSQYGQPAHLFSMLAFFAGGVLATTFVFLKSRSSGHNIKWLTFLVLLLATIAFILIPTVA